MKLPKNRESGQALVMALILLGLGSLLVVPMLSQGFTSLKYHHLIECKTVNSYSADAGVEYALCKLYNNPGGYVDTSLDESFTLNNRTVNVTAEYQGGGIYKITSTASGGGCGSTTITAYVNLSAGAFTFVIAAKDYMSLELVTVDSLPDPNEGNIHSNGNIALGGNVLVKGDASAVGTITGGTVTGMVTAGAPEVAFPGDYSELYKTMAREVGTYIGDVTLTGGTLENPIIFPSATYPYAYIQGNLTISPNSFVRLTSTVYVTGTIAMKPGSLLDGEENILAEQSITIEGGAVRSNRIPVVTSTGTSSSAIYCSGSGANVVMNAVLYAPNGGVVITGKAELYGAVGGKTVDINNATITYAKELQGRQDLPGGELATISYSFD